MGVIHNHILFDNIFYWMVEMPCIYLLDIVGDLLICIKISKFRCCQNRATMMVDCETISQVWFNGSLLGWIAPRCAKLLRDFGLRFGPYLSILQNIFCVIFSNKRRELNCQGLGVFGWDFWIAKHFLNTLNSEIH